MKTFNLVPLSTINPSLRIPVPFEVDSSDLLSFAVDNLSDVVDKNWAPNAYTVEGFVTGTAIVEGGAQGFGSMTPDGAPAAQVILQVPISDIPITNTTQPDFNTEMRTMVNWGGYPRGDGPYDVFFADSSSFFPFGITSGGTALGGCLLRATSRVLVTLSPYAFRFEDEFYAAITVDAGVTIDIAHPGGDVILDEASDIDTDPESLIPPSFLVPQGYSFGTFPPNSHLATTEVGTLELRDVTRANRSFGSVTLYNEGVGQPQSLTLKIRNRFL